MAACSPHADNIFPKSSSGRSSIAWQWHVKLSPLGRGQNQTSSPSMSIGTSNPRTVSSCQHSMHNRPSSINLFAVFLAAPMSYDDDGIPFYPTAKMGDFGGAIGTGEQDPRNPMKYKSMGTVSYRAPVSTIPFISHDTSMLISSIQGAKVASSRIWTARR